MDWRNVKKFVVGEPYDAEVEYLESNGTQTLPIPNLYPNVFDVQVTGGANQTIAAVGAANRTRKVWTNANGEYAVFGTSSGDDSFGISGSLRKTIAISIPSTIAVNIDATIDGVTKRGLVSRASSVSSINVFGTSALGFGTLRLYGVDHYKLVRVGQVGCLYDPDTGDFIYPSTGTLACGPDVRVINRQDVVKISTSAFPLVPGAKRVEYLESTGTQYVDTGMTVNTTTDEVRASCEMIGTTAYRYLFGVMQSGAYFGVGRDNSNTYLLYASGATSKPLSYITGGRHEIISDSNGLSIDGTTMFQYASFASTAPVYLFNLNRPGNTNNYKSASRIYGFKVVRNGATILDLLPIRVGTTGYLYDKVSSQLFGNAGTGNFVCGPEVAETVLWKKPVPYDSEVEYLESTGTQWVNTGLVVAPGMRMDINMAITNWDATQYSLTGAGGIRFTFGKGWSGSSTGTGNPGKLYFGLGNQNLATTTALSSLVNQRHTYSLDAAAAKAWLDGSTSWDLASAGTISTGTNPILIFAQSTGQGSGNVRGQQAAKLYSAKFTVNGVTIRDFIPVRVGTTGYLFDRISWTLFGNAGTGSFGYGADVPDSW